MFIKVSSNMKKIVLVVLVCGFSKLFGQETIRYETHSQIFSLSPIAKRVDKVNGLVLGVGHYDSRYIDKQTINGINLEANPMGLAIPFFIFYLPEIISKNKQNIDKDSLQIVDIEKEKPLIQLNGLNVSSGCFMTATNVNGLSVSPFNKINKMNGINITALGLKSDVLNGFSLGGYNGTNKLNGVCIGLFNETYCLKGMQIGFYNFSVANSGVQIGVFNMSKSKGFQIGLWNINNKRSMPFINW
jgi:hypothetical protein